MGKIVLVLGGTKSGKTGWAQAEASRLSERTGKNVSYIATAEALDGGMADRIAKHRQSRNPSWETWEQPLSVHSIISDAAAGKAAVVLDCFTLLATNIILQGGDEPERETAVNAVLTEAGLILAAARQIEPALFIISNLVEVGLVAPTPLGGLFQDIAGLSHQRLAAGADDVVLMTAGIPQKLKSGTE